MKKLVLLISILIIGCLFTACTALPYVASVLEAKPDTSTKRAWLSILEKDNDKQLSILFYSTGITFSFK
jgi:NADPH-dependent ferric siderophore reductase